LDGGHLGSAYAGPFDPTAVCRRFEYFKRFFSFFSRFQLTLDPVVIIMTETASAALPGSDKSVGSANF
jgi:hypothetical protein